MRLRAACFIIGWMLAGCAYQNPASTGTPAPPTPPQVTVANSMIALATGLNAATDALIACRNQNKCSAADVNAAENVVKTIATVGKQIDLELNSTDAWAVQKQRILAFIAAAGVGQLKAQVSPTTQLVIAGVVSIFDTVSLAVGGPTI